MTTVLAIHDTLGLVELPWTMAWSYGMLILSAIITDAIDHLYILHTIYNVITDDL